MIDHLVYGVPDLDGAVEDLEVRFGVRAAPGGKHLGIGTHNALLALGPRTYLEVIAPDPDQPTPANPRPFGIDDLTTPRLVGWAIGCDHIGTAIAAARAAGYDPGDAIEMTRAAPDGTVLRWRLTLNALAGGAIPFLISWGDTEHPATSAPHGLVLTALEIDHPNPHELARTFDALAADVAVRAADRWALVAHVRGSAGIEVLR